MSKVPTEQEENCPLGAKSGCCDHGFHLWTLVSAAWNTLLHMRGARPYMWTDYGACNQFQPSNMSLAKTASRTPAGERKLLASWEM